MDAMLILFVLTAFLGVAGLLFAAGQIVLDGSRMRRRLVVGEAGAAAGVQSLKDRTAVPATRTGDDRFGVDETLHQKLRLKLLRCGFFGRDAVRYYLGARILCSLAFPFAALAIYLASPSQFSMPGAALLMSIAVAAGFFGPDAYLSYRRTKQAREYRLNFPDLLDLLTVCVSAGLTVEKAFERIRDQFRQRSPALGHNIELMGAEMRAGRSAVDALGSLAERLGLDEAASFVAVLKHSLELGGDVATSLRSFSEDMRTKRLLFAEKRANELAVKMSLPLAFGIFPVILMIVLLPVILRLAQVIGR